MNEPVTLLQKALPILEVLVVVGLFFTLRAQLSVLPMATWQTAVFGAAPVSSSLLLFMLPLAFILALRRNVGSAGLTTQGFEYHRRVALVALAVVAPATTLFPVITLIGADPMQWVGGAILTVGFITAGLVMLRFVRGLPSEPEATTSLRGLLAYISLLAVGLIVVAALHWVWPLLGRMVWALLFVGFLEEFFFRGYVQSRLNDSLGKPFRLHGVNVGAGLVLAALLFGLLHPLTALSEDTPWAWALWTTALGLILGFLREKTGAVVAPAVVHGVILLPGVLFGAV